MKKNALMVLIASSLLVAPSAYAQKTDKPVISGEKFLIDFFQSFQPYDVIHENLQLQIPAGWLTNKKTPISEHQIGAYSSPDGNELLFLEFESNALVSEVSEYLNLKQFAGRNWYVGGYVEPDKNNDYKHRKIARAFFQSFNGVYIMTFIEFHSKPVGKNTTVNYRQIEKILNSAKFLSEPTFDQQLNDARQIAESGDYEKALLKLAFIDKSHPRYSQVEQAKTLFQNQRDNHLGESALSKAVALAEKEQFEEALEILSQVPATSSSAEIARQKEKAWQEIVESTKGKKLFDAAMKRAIAKDFEGAIALIKEIPLASDYYTKGYQKEIEWTKIIEETKGKAHFEAGMKYAVAGDFERALDEIREVLSVAPAKSPYWKKAYEKEQSWEKIVRERKGKKTYEAAYKEASQGNFRQAVQLAKEVPENSSYSRKAQSKITEWQKIIDRQEYDFKKRQALQDFNNLKIEVLGAPPDFAKIIQAEKAPLIRRLNEGGRMTQGLYLPATLTLDFRDSTARFNFWAQTEANRFRVLFDQNYPLISHFGMAYVMDSIDAWYSLVASRLPIVSANEEWCKKSCHLLKYNQVVYSVGLYKGDAYFRRYAIPNPNNGRTPRRARREPVYLDIAEVKLNRASSPVRIEHSRPNLAIREFVFVPHYPSTPERQRQFKVLETFFGRSLLQK